MMDDNRTPIARLTRGFGLWLLLLLSLQAAAGGDSSLGPWRQKLAETRLLAENDFSRADADASSLQEAVPADATPADRAALFNLQARIDLYLGRTEQAARHIRLAFDLAHSHGDKIGQAEADLNLAMNAINQARIDDMNQAVMDAMTVLEGVERPDLLAEAMLRASMMYRRMEQLDDSVAVAVQAMDIAKRSSNALALAYANQAMAAAYDVNHRGAEALEYYRQMRERAVAAGSKRLEAEALIGIGGMENQLGNIENGDAAIRQATETFRALHAPFYLAHALVRSAEGLRLRGRLADTIGLLNEAESLHRQGNNKIGLWWVLYIRYGNYLTLGETSKAQADAENGYRLAKEIGFPLYLSKSAKSLADIAAAGGDHKRAYRLMAEADEMASKAAAETASSRMVDLANHYQNEIKQRQIEELNQRNRLQQAEIGQRALQQRWLRTVLAASFLLLAATLFFIARLRLSQRRLRILNHQVVEAGNKLQATLDTIPDLMFEVDLDGRYYDCHAPKPELLAASRETLLGKTVVEVMPAEAAAVFLEALREALRCGLSFGKQLMVPRPQGESWFELSVAAKPAVSGETPRFIVMSRDISERKQTERLLHEREQAIRAVVDNSPDYIVRYDARFRRVYVNPTVQKLFGLPLDQILGKTPAESTPIQQDMTAMLEAVFERAQEVQAELPFRKEDGSTGWADIRMVPEFGPDDSVATVLSIGRDISERKRLDNDLRMREQYQRALLDSFPFMVWLKDTESRLLAVNRPYLETAGLPADAPYFGMTDLDLFPTELAQQYRADDQEVMRSGQRKTVEEWVGTPAALRWHETSKTPVWDGEGNLLGTVGFARDITDRKASEYALRESEEKYRTLIQKIQTAVIVHGPDTQILISNPVAQDILGLSEELLNRKTSVDPVWHFFREDGSPTPPEEYPVNQVLASRQPLRSCVFGVHRPHQDDVWVLVNADPVFGPDGDITQVIVTFIDITLRKHAENALKESEWRYREIFENVSDALYLVEVTPDGRFRNLAFNKAFEQSTGVPREKLIGREAGRAVAEGTLEDETAKTVVAKYRSCIEAGKAIEEESVLDLPSGRRTYYSTLVPLRDESGRICRILGLARDVTELKRVEREFRTLAENIPDNIIRFDDRARITFMNAAMVRLLESESGTLPGQVPEDTSAEKLVMKIDAFSEKLSQVLETGEAQELEVALQDAIEGMRIHAIKFVAERDEQGHIVGALAIGHDITALKAAENELKERERRYREIFENVTDSLFLIEVTPEGRFRNLAFNFAFEQSMGVQREDLVGIDVGGVAIEEEADETHSDVAKYRRCLKAGSNIEEEVVLDLPSGRRHFHSTLVPLYDESGRICRILGIAHDVTERKRAEEQIRALNISLEQQILERTAELRQQTRYLRTLVDSLPLLVWLKDTESRFVMVNQAAAESSGLSIEEMIGKSDLDLWARDVAEAYVEEDKRVMQTRRRSVVEKLVTQKNHSVWIEIDKVPVLDDDGSVLGTVGVVRNISERKALEIARENALAEAIRLANLRSEFMARMSHELRTPLNGILGYAQVLQRDKGVDERKSAMLNVIQESGEHLLHLINDILDFAKIEAGKQTLTLSDVPLRRFLRNLAGIVSIRAEQKQLAFRCEVAEDVPEVIRADEMRLRQVLLNLLSNAVKFSDQGSIELRVTLESKAEEAEASAICRLRFQIKDSGVGIEAGKLESIFQPFEQAGDSRQGTGLGLAISRELVRLMGGEIRVDSRVGEGSNFWFDLDVVNVRGVACGIDLETGAYQVDRDRALVACTSEESRNQLTELLGRLGFETFSVATGAACLDIAQNRMPELIVLVEGLPDMSGLETLRRLRRLSEAARAPIIVLGADASDEEIAYAMAAAASVFLTMPIDSETLAETITELFRLDGRHPPAEGHFFGQHSLQQAMDLPPQEELEMLYRFAREGSMRDIIRQAAHLVELDERYRPFAEQLRTLASAYQSKAILELVSRYVDKQPIVL